MEILPREAACYRLLAFISLKMELNWRSTPQEKSRRACRSSKRWPTGNLHKKVYSTRLFSKEQLTAEDIEDLYALLKAEHGIPDTKGRTAIRLKVEQIPAPDPPEARFKMVAIKNL